MKIFFPIYFLQAYRKLAKEYHPDKNPEAGDKVCDTTAYEALMYSAVTAK